MNEEEEYYINELNNLLNEYNPNDTIYEIILSIIILFFYGIILATLGYLLTIILLLIGLFLINELKVRIKVKPNSSQIAYQACLIMESLIILKNPKRTPNTTIIHAISHGKHEELYKKFIELYPHLSSQKLDKLSKIDS